MVVDNDLQMPWNPTTGRPFTRGNADRLETMAAECGYDSLQWATYRQWLSAGRQVRKGERGVRCLLPTVRKGEDGTETVSGRPRKAFTVFNAEQTDPVASPADAGRTEMAPVLDRG